MCMQVLKIRQTALYKKWFNALDKNIKLRVQKRIDRLFCGNFGDYKALGDNVYEMRFHFGSGYRIYYTFDGGEVVLLLAGGDKATQSDDIINAKRLANRRR